MNDVAIVTVAIGEPYFSKWTKYCASNWQNYGTKHNIDVICINQPLDDSELARSRSPSWQKCLVLNQPWATKYRQIVLLDSDVVINVEKSPDITADVPMDKVGG